MKAGPKSGSAPVLSCSAAFTHDLVPQRLETPVTMKLATAVSVTIALLLALSESRSVFSLVILAWSTLAAAFAPLLALYALRRRVSELAAIVMLVGGVIISLVWRFGLGWHNQIYEGLPAISLAFAFGWFVSKRVDPSTGTVGDDQIR